MKKILTVSIAAYNVQDYIENALKSLLVKNIDDLEILVEDDGGTDNTANIAKEYEKKYPGIVKLVHKENGGYGSTINKSIEIAQGKYFKQLDGDDWYDSENFEKLLELLRKIDTDIVYTPFKEYKEKTGNFELKDLVEENIHGEYNLEDIIGDKKEYLVMHTLLYKTELLKNMNLKLLEHCFYTDTQYAMYPFSVAKTIYVIHSPIYIYRVGREEQSVSLSSHIKHYEDRIKVSKEIVRFYNENMNSLTKDKQDYLFNYIKIHTSNTISSFLVILDPCKKNLNILKEFDNYILKENKQIYQEMYNQSKIVKIIRSTKYNYLVYKVLSKIKRKKMK